MSTSNPARGSHGPRRAKRMTALALSLGIAVTSLPVALAAPALATTTKGGCSVTPLRPVYKPATLFSEAKVDYRVKVYCDAGRSVEIWQERYEEDPPPNPDDKLGLRHKWNLTYVISDTQVVSIERSAPDTEPTPEEVYQLVRFRVTPFFGEAGSRTPWEKSPVEEHIG